MRQKLFNWFDHVARMAPGWMFVTAGVAILAVTLILPSFLQTRRLAWERDLLLAQEKVLADQRADYRKVIADIEKGDPVLLERLAYHYRHEKPANVVLLTDGAAAQPAAAERYSNVDNWLARPIPTPGDGYPEFSPTSSRLVRLTSGPIRLAVMALGVLCLALGLIRPPQTSAPDGVKSESLFDGPPEIVGRVMPSVVQTAAPVQLSTLTADPDPLPPVAQPESPSEPPPQAAFFSPLAQTAELEPDPQPTQPPVAEQLSGGDEFEDSPVAV